MLRPNVVRLLATLVPLLLLTPVTAQPAEQGGGLSGLFPWAVFDPNIPTQQELVGVEPAERPLTHAEVLRYMTALAEASPRARVIPYSETHEGRRMIYLAVSDGATVARLEEFRGEHARNLDPRNRPAADDGALVAQAKAVAWMAYGIHGDELSSVDAAVSLAYWLVAGEDERAERLRRELVILIDPMENPDGRDRYLAQTRSFAHSTPNPDGEDLSHTTVWPWGRGNHYLFDLNRDWFSMVQPESRRSEVISTWNPQLMVDSHEMGDNSTYLFSPARHPFNPHLPPSNLKWADRFGEDQARALDSRGYPYFTREWNEEFFPGYGSSWPMYRGAVGILYEMSGTSGTLVRKRAGTLRTYPQAVEHQVTSSVANLETLATNRAAILEDFVADRREVVRRGREGPIGAWLLPEGRHPDRTRKLVDLMRRQGIEVLHSTGRPQADGLRDALTGAAVSAEELSGPAWMVPLDQPSALLARQILDPHVPMEAGFFREEREYLERGKGSRLYETTAWSLALGYGIEAYWTAERPKRGWVEAPAEPFHGELVSADNPTGYLIDGRSDRSTGALADLLQQGISVKVAEKPFSLEGRDYERGTLLIPVEGNADDLEDHLADLAQRWHVGVRAVSTARATSGPDLGGSHFRDLVAPRVGVWTASPVSPSSYGAVWHLLDEELKLRFSALDVSRFGRRDLSRYNVLVFPSSSGYEAELGESGRKRLQTWIEAGGTAIGLGNGADFLADVGSGLTQVRMRRQALEQYPTPVLGPSAVEARAAGRFMATGIRAPEEKKDDDEKDEKKETVPEVKRTSPYDVAPILGPGAVPFAEGFEQGTAVAMKPVDLAKWLKPYLPPGKAKPDKEDLERADQRLRRFSPRGTFLRVELDHDVFLTWGVPHELPVLARGSDSLVGGPPTQVAARFADLDKLHLGGLLWPEAAARLAHTAYLTRESKGRGQIILFQSEPEFRGWTLATRRLLVNALLYGPGLGTRWSTPW